MSELKSQSRGDSDTNTKGEVQPVIFDISGNDMPSKKARELAILRKSWVFGMESGCTF